MNYLLDTHIILWMFDNDPRLSLKARDIILNPSNELYYSIASLWEIAIKKRAKKEKFNYSAASFLADCESIGLHRLSIRDLNVLEYEKLPELHTDPFDNMLVAQARSEGMQLMTHDHKLEQFGSDVIMV